VSDTQQRIVTGLKWLWIAATLVWWGLWVVAIVERGRGLPWYLDHNLAVLIVAFFGPIGVAIAGMLIGWIVMGFLGKPNIKWWGYRG